MSTSNYTKTARFPSSNTPPLGAGFFINALRSHLEKSYGGAWNYNEIIGYIRLHILGTQIRGEYFAVNKKRILRTRNRQLEFKTWKLAPEVEIQDPFNDTNILAAIYQYIDDCRRELPSRFIDSEVFDGLSGFVNWERLFNENDA